MAGITEIMLLLDTGEALMIGEAILLPTRIRHETSQVPPANGTRNYWREWGKDVLDANAIEQTVETLRRQTRIKD